VNKSTSTVYGSVTSSSFVQMGTLHGGTTLHYRRGGGRYDVVVDKKSFPGWVAEPEKRGRFHSIVEAVNSAPQGDPKFLAAFQKDVN
jgi:hypothetical protein